MSTPANMLALPPGADPQQYAELMRQQQIAQAAAQMALSPSQVQQPQATKGVFQEARVSPVSGLARIAAALMARKGMDSSNAGLAQMYAQGLQQFQPGGQPVPQNPTSGGTSDSSGASYPTGGAPSGAAPPPPPQRQTQQTTPINPLNPQGMDARSLYRLYLQDPQKYLDMIKGTPEWQTALAANGGDVSATQAALKAKMTKEGAISNRSGEENMIPDPSVPGGYRFIRTPNLGPNQDFTRNPDGSIAETHLIPGTTPALEAEHQAEETGKERGTLQKLTTQGGGTKYVFGIPQVPGAPAQPPQGPPAPPRAAPAPGAPQAPPGGAPPARYFPPVQPGPAAGAPQQGPPVPPGVTPGIWRGAPQRPDTSGLGEDPYVAGKVKTMVEKDNELSNKYGSESDLADQRIAFNNEALRVLSKSNTGPLSDSINAMAAKAHELGLNLPWLPDQDTVNNSAELKKFLLRNPLLSLKPTFGGRPAASEFQILANDASPSPQMLQGAIARLVQLDNQAAGFSKQRATDYGYYHDQLKGDPSRFESYYANKVPFARWLDQNPQGRPGEAHVEAGGGPTGGGPSQADIEAEMRRRGLLK